MVSKSDSPPQSPDGPSSFDETTGISYGDRSSPGLEQHAARDQSSEVSNSGSRQKVVNLTGLISRMSGNASADVIVPSSEVHSPHSLGL